MSRKGGRAKARRAAGGGTAEAPATEAGAASSVRPGALPGPRSRIGPGAGALGLLVILAAAAWLHGGALRQPFFADDYLFLDQVRSASLPAVLAEPDPLGNFFRPVGRQLWFWTLSRASGESPLAFHLAALFVFLLTITLLFALAQRVAGTGAALVAAAITALHYAADVPIRWASGGQDLLAVAGAIGALLLFVAGRAVPAALVLLLALLSKETVVFAPLVAVVLGRRAGEPWAGALRRAWPLFAATALWALLWFAAMSRGAGGAGVAVERDPLGIATALAHFAQVLAGIEWPGFAMPQPEEIVAWGPLVLVAAVLAYLLPLERARRAATRGGIAAAPGASPARGAAIAGGAVWAVVGALPVAAVASAWSAYYYLFAVCGAALALGAWLARRPPAVAVAIVIALGIGTQVGRHLAEFSTAERITNTSSRINRFYIDRSMRFVGRYLEDLKEARPELPPGSTLFFSGVPSFVAWQAADGPLVRWAYRDSSLRSYYQTALTIERVKRGPAFFFVATRDSLMEVPPDGVSFRDIGITLLLDGREDAAHDAWTLHAETHPAEAKVQYWLGMMEALERSPDGPRRLQAAGVSLKPGPTPHIETALRMLAAGDTARAWEVCLDGVAAHAADPGIHALLADVSLSRPMWQDMGIFESWLVHRMAPEDLPSMRRWAGVLVTLQRFERGVDLFERYLAAGGESPETNALVRRWIDSTRRRLKGGDLAGEGLRSSVSESR